MSLRVHSRLRHIGLAVLLLASTAPAAPAAASATGTAGATTPRQAPLLQGLGGHHHDIESRDSRVRRYFDQGMLLVYGFNPEEAARSFEAALAIDPACASCWWALAWALGPNINTDMAPQAEPRVLRALGQARLHASRASPARRALIEALSLRHPGPAQLDEEAYAQRLQALATRHPKNADLAVLAAEALLNLHPYDWWSADGQALPWTPAIEALLQRALHLQPGHPGAHHYWIHLQESSARPQRAQASADRLRSAYPGSGHLLHMPSHIDMRSGRFDAAIRANQRSIEADRRYLEQVDAQGAYRIGYVAHNHHFLWAAAAMAGRGQLALDAARAAWPAACGPSGRDPGTAITMHYAALPYFTLVRFGLWDEILRGTAPPDAPGPYALALWHYARGTAYSRTGEPAQAQRELAALDRLAAEPSLAAARLKNLNPSAQVLRIAQLSLRADIALATGRASEAVSLLREATAIEDAFSYDEPHLWLAPTRHALGDTLLAAHQPRDAEQVYRQDLAHYPENGWSLAGLARALQAQGRHDEARAVERRFKAAWRDADRALIRSRY